MTSDTNDELSAAIRSKRAAELLLKTEGWVYLLEFINTGIDLRMKTILEPLHSTDDAPRQEFMKGVMYGMKMIREWPQLVVETANELIEQENTQKEEQTDYGED